MAKIPGVDSVVGSLLTVVQLQTEAVRSLTEMAGSARDTVVAVNRLVHRVDALVEEMEGPMRELAPGLSRLARVLDDPSVEELPKVLNQVQKDVLPVLRTLADTHEKVAFIAGSTERIMAFVDDTGRTIAALPGAALLGRRKPASPPAP